VVQAGVSFSVTTAGDLAGTWLETSNHRYNSTLQAARQDSGDDLQKNTLFPSSWCFLCMQKSCPGNADCSTRINQKCILRRIL